MLKFKIAMTRIYPILIAIAILPSVADAQMPSRTSMAVNFTDRNTGQPIAGTDVGRFQSGENNIVIVPDGSDDTIVCRFRSPSGNCYRLSVKDGKGHVPVPLIDKATFENFTEQFRARPNWGICEIIENPWSAWSVVGSIPTAEGWQTYTEQRTCSTGGNANACPDTCSVATETRTQTVYNEPVCNPNSWTPPTYHYYYDQLFTQTNDCGQSRNVYGSADYPEIPTYYPPEPAPYVPPEPPEPPEPTAPPVTDPLITDPVDNSPPKEICETYGGYWGVHENYFDPFAPQTGGLVWIEGFTICYPAY